MKTTAKILTTLLFFSISLLAQAQNRVAVLDYMKVEPGSNGEYQNIEKEWRKIHQARIDAGIIQQWELFEKVFSGADDPYHYITVTIFDDFRKTENPFPGDLKPDGMSNEDLQDLLNRTGKSRVLVQTEVYHFVSGTEGGNRLKYLLFNKMKVKEGQDAAYRKMEDEVFKPLHQENADRGYQSGWSLWAKWPNPDNDFHYVTVDGYTEYGQWMNGEDILADVHPEKSWSEISEMAINTRDLVGTEIWRLVDILPAQEDMKP